MPGENIIDLEGLLQPYIGPNKKIIDVKKERLTAPGENYCSLMLKLDVTLKNLQTGEEEELHAVAKTINTEVNEFFKKTAPPQFKKEIAFYTEIVPALQEFQREQGITEVIDLFPKLYAARKNLHGTDDEVDDDCVIVLENLKVQGYTNIDRVLGFDLDGAKLVLKDLALFHALSVAFRQKKPDIFNEKIEKYCFNPFPKMELFGEAPKPDWVTYILNHEKAKPFIRSLSEVFGALAEEGPYSFKNKPKIEPFLSLFHGDMWCNNTMQVSENGKLTKNKILDMQLYLYGSTIGDLLFFIWTSIQYEVVKNNYEELTKFYYDIFSKTLKELDVDTTIFNYSMFLETINRDAPIELLHILFMTSVVKGRKEEAAIDVNKEIVEMVNAATTSNEAKEKMIQVIVEFGERGWIRKPEHLCK